MSSRSSSIAGADQTRDEIVPGIDLLGFDERLEHGDNRVGRLLGRRILARSRCGHEHIGESLPEWGTIPPGHAEELADDRKGKWECEGGDQIDPAIGSLAAMSSMRSSVMVWTRGRKASTRLVEKARIGVGGAGCDRAGRP